MAKKLESLKREAAQAAQFRGHKLGAWADYPDDTAHADCEVCDRRVVVDASPPPNGIDIAGSAVAVSCSERRIRISYDVVTEESARDGDFAENGWENEEGVCIAPDEWEVDGAGSELAVVVKLAAGIIGHCVEASDYPRCHSGHTWYTEIDAEPDYEDGSEKRRSFHLDGFSEEEELAIYAELCGR